MCNTRSEVYLQSTKTYVLSVNTLMWNLTSERHDNCAPCLGLILPIRWVTPPPNFLEDFHLASWLHYLHIWFVFNIHLSSRFIFTKPLDGKRFCKLRCELNILESSNVLWSGTHPNTYACWWLRCATHEVKYIFNKWRLTFWVWIH